MVKRRALLVALVSAVALAGPVSARDRVLPPNDPVRAWGFDDVHAAEAWEQGRATGRGVIVSVVDTGLAFDHPDLACPGKIDRARQGNFVADLPQGSEARDYDGHGTHVAGIIGACANNALDTAGVAPDVTLRAYRVARGASGSTWDVIRGIRAAAAADPKPHVIHLSLSALADPLEAAGTLRPYGVSLFDSVTTAVEDAAADGIVVIAAAGNGAWPLCFEPAHAPSAVCVGAVAPDHTRSWYSNAPFKPHRGHPSRSLVAPGDDIHSLWLTGTGARSGTPMAAGYVAGAAALLYERLGGVVSKANADRVVDALLHTAKPLGAVPALVDDETYREAARGFDPDYGWGLLDVDAAVRSIAAAKEDTGLSATFEGPGASRQSVVSTLVSTYSGRPLAGQALDLLDDGVHIGAATTDRDGVATFDLANRGRATSDDLEVHYAGSGRYAEARAPVR